MTKVIQVNNTITIGRTHSSQSDADGPIVTDNNSWKFADLLANGTGSDQAKIAFHDIRTLTDTANETLDLTGSLRDGFGDLITFTAIKLIAIALRTDTADGDLQVGGGSAALPWLADTSDKIKIRPGGALIWWSPKSGATVTDTTADKLLIQNLSTGSILYEILLIGTTS